MCVPSSESINMWSLVDTKVTRAAYSSSTLPSHWPAIRLSSLNLRVSSSKHVPQPQYLESRRSPLSWFVVPYLSQIVDLTADDHPSDIHDLGRPSHPVPVTRGILTGLWLYSNFPLTTSIHGPP